MKMEGLRSSKVQVQVFSFSILIVQKQPQAKASLPLTKRAICEDIGLEIAVEIEAMSKMQFSNLLSLQ